MGLSWPAIVQMLTFYIPGGYPGGTSDENYAWRQKLALCILMLLYGVLFVVTCGLLPIFCILMKDQYLSVDQCSIAVPIYSTVLGLLLFSYLAKFFGSLFFHFKSSKKYEDKLIDANIIIHIPCYTENEEEMRRVIESARDTEVSIFSKKVMFIVVDGLVAGQNCDKLTAECVLEILSGTYDRTSAKTYNYLSLGDAEMQQNTVEVYHGIFDERNKEPVPYIVVVKCGNAHEMENNGNRGKRDSQFILFDILKNLAYGDTIGKLGHGIIDMFFELTGVHLRNFEFVATIDADTKVDQRCLQYFTSYMYNNAKTIAACGDSEVANGRESWVTAIQVFERFMETNMLRPYEAYFGSVICLPGFLSFFRIKSADIKRQPILVDKEVHESYFNFTLDSLHRKNIIIGEDRLLTQLLLKHFPHGAIGFVKEATSQTIVPAKWSALMSQRRRWLNTTLHNACGFLALTELPFAVKFTLAIDLFNSICLPAVLAVLVICAWITVIHYGVGVLIILICLLIATRVIIIAKTEKFDMLLWMVIYHISEPIIWLVILPIHAYWNMDNVSWGKTRKVNHNIGNNAEPREEPTQPREEPTPERNVTPIYSHVLP